MSLKNTDSLFFESGNAWNLACLDHGPRYGASAWIGYVKGYIKAADSLVEVALEDRNQLDSLVYPIVFLYRHYIEIQLKSLLVKMVQLTGNEKYEYKTSHRLDGPWAELRPFLSQNGCEDSLLNAVSSLLLEFQEKDPTSFLYRYPENPQKAPNNLEIKHLNVEQLRETMRKLQDFFEIVSFGLDCELSKHQEDLEYLYGAIQKS